MAEHPGLIESLEFLHRSFVERWGFPPKAVLMSKVDYANLCDQLGEEVITYKSCDIHITEASQLCWFLEKAPPLVNTDEWIAAVEREMDLG